jgi:hypothetical protein
MTWTFLESVRFDQDQAYPIVSRYFVFAGEEFKRSSPGCDARTGPLQIAEEPVAREFHDLIERP